MARITALNTTRHRHLKVRRERVEAQSADVRMMPLMVAEFQKAATQYPILFTKNPETGAFAAVALFGFDAQENLFWREGQWDGLYVPLNVERHPFFIGQDEGEADSFTLCIDLESPCCVEGTGGDGDALFDDSGAPSAYLQHIQSIMGQLVDGEGQTKAFIETLSAHDLVTELALDIQFENAEKQRVQGLYSIDEAKLNALSPEALLDLRKRGYLPPIYAMIISLGQIFGLVQRKNARNEKAQQWFQPAAEFAADPAAVTE